MNKYHKHKRFDEYCDYCGEPTRLYDEMDEWKEFERDTISLKICRRCDYENYIKTRTKEIREEVTEKINKEKEEKTVDKRKGFWYTIFKKLKRR